MKIQLKIVIILFFTFSYVASSLGQSAYPLKDSGKNKRKGIYLNVKMVDSLDYIKIFLVNRSDKAYQYFGFHGHSVSTDI